MNIHAVTYYTNPAGFKTRRDNYAIFAGWMLSHGYPLLTVAQTFDAPLDIAANGETIHHIIGGAVCWQKEVGLNLGVLRLPKDVDAVLLVDCDFLFPPDFSAKLGAAMLTHNAVQCFRALVHLPPGETEYTGIGEVVSGRVASARGDRPDKGSPGGAWCIRRDILDKHGLYPFCITGSGDMPLAMAALGIPYKGMRDHMSPKMVPGCEKWMNDFTAAVDGKVSFLPVLARHLWHGSRKDRKYMDRHHIMAEWNFDPDKDVKYNADGVLEWASDKPGLHQFMREYFPSRKEDDPCLDCEERKRQRALKKSPFRTWNHRKAVTTDGGNGRITS